MDHEEEGEVAYPTIDRHEEKIGVEEMVEINIKSQGFKG